MILDKLAEFANAAAVFVAPAAATVTLTAATDVIAWTAHGMQTGAAFNVTGGGAGAGITRGTTYFAIVVDANSIKAATTVANALAATAIDITTDSTPTCTGTVLGFFGGEVLGNVVDTQIGSLNTLLNIGDGQPTYLEIQVPLTSLVGTGATVQFQLVSDSTADLNTSRTVHLDTGAVAIASLVAAAAGSVTPSYSFVQRMAMQSTYERYLGLWVTVAVANVTAGKVNAFLTKDVRRFLAHAGTPSANP